MPRLLERLTGCGAGLRREKRQPQAGQDCRTRLRELIHEGASNLVPARAQRQREVVIDLSGYRANPAASYWANADDAGKRTTNVAPVPGWLETSSVPPCASTMALEIASPKPARPCDVVRAASAR